MRSFREVGWVVAVAGTTLGCYMVNLKVASERAALEEVSDRIVLAQRDIRVLQTEIGTRGRLEQLESWNVKVLALSAPQAHQFLEGGYQLATLTAPKRTVDPAAPVVLAAAPAPASSAQGQGNEAQPAAPAGAARDMMHVASMKRDLPEAAPKKAVDKGAGTADRPVKAAPEAAKAAPKAEKERKAATKTAGAAEASAKPRPKAGPASATSSTKLNTKPDSKDVQARQ